ncbi:MAG TPA: hypothetical protein VFW14_05335 [Gaiellales bacterium]|jgi:transposase InsO family protein|nr:hypothetical protein [Gaiellales bacterium]
MAEAWVATYKTELVAGRLLSFEHLEHETLQWISFSNHDRLHEELGDLPPSEYEALMRPSPPAALQAARGQPASAT